MEMFAANLDAIYATLGVEASLEVASATYSITVIDKSQGVLIEDHKAGIATMIPGAVVRVSELTENALARSDCRQAILTMNDKFWRVENTKPLPTPRGESEGELLLLLIEVETSSG